MGRFSILHKLGQNIQKIYYKFNIIVFLIQTTENKLQIKIKSPRNIGKKTNLTVNMKTILTDEKDERFHSLVAELDAGYFERVGEDLHKYESYNEFKNPHTVILAFDGNDAVACASYRIFNENSVEFKRVFVKKEYRRRGIAYFLIRELEQLVIKDNFKHSYIVTGKKNFEAINLYKKLDYKTIDNFGQFRDDDVVICMKKDF